MRKLIVLAALMLCPRISLANENDALALAVKDVLAFPPSERHCLRYVYLSTGTHEDMQLTSLTLNYISRSELIVRPFPVAKTLLRLDLRHYAPPGKARDEWRATWYELRFDPVFSLLLTRDTLKFSVVVIPEIVVPHAVLVDCPPYVEDGVTYKQRWVKQNRPVKEIRDEDVVKVLSPHIDATLFASLADATGTECPIVNHRYFIARALSTIKDKGVYRTIYGGLYYDFVGIGTGAKKGTDEDAFFEQIGVGDVELGLTAKKIYDRVRSDQRVAVFRSGITGRPRRIDFLRQLAGRLEDVQSFVSVTHDIKAEAIDIGTHPIMNLLNFKDDAREVIFEKQNGLHGFVLFDGNGKRQDEVPPDIAADHSVPAPHATRLQPAIGCIRCHASESGWRVVHNDVKKLVGGLFDIFPSRKTDEIDHLARLYAGDVERKLLPRGRDDYNSSILRATGPWKSGKKDQTEIAKETAGALSAVWADYWYRTVGAQQALVELGVTGDPKAATKTLRDKLPPPAIVVDGRVPEDPRIGALLVGLEIGRTDFDLVRSFMASRMKAAKR